MLTNFQSKLSPYKLLYGKTCIRVIYGKPCEKNPPCFQRPLGQRSPMLNKIMRSKNTQWCQLIQTFFCPVMTMRKKQILARATGIQKDN